MNRIFTFAILFAASGLAIDAENNSDQIQSILSDARRNRWSAVSTANREYRAAISTTFKFADRVEVYLLDSSMGTIAADSSKDADKIFPIRPYDKETKIIKTVEVPAQDVPHWSAAAAKLVGTAKKGGQDFCHYPIHGIRIYAGDELLFETSICWQCSNYYFSYDGQALWESLTEDAKDLKKLLEDSMRIPTAETTQSDGSKSKSK